MIPASEVTATVTLEGQSETVERFDHGGPEREPEAKPLPAPARQADATVSLRQLAWARSGDKGDTCNVGIIAREPEYLPYIAAGLSDETLAKHYGFMLREDSSIERHYLPGSHALNILLKGALDGGCTVSLRFDPFGKSAAQDALDIPIAVPADLVPG